MAEGVPIGVVAERSGVAASALRYYEERGLIESMREGHGRRHYRPDVLRRLAFIQAAQRVGLSLDEIDEALHRLPADRAPTARQWNQLAESWRPLLDERIRLMEQLRDDLRACIGCGCLSLGICRLVNPDDAAGADGAGPRYLAGFGAALDEDEGEEEPDEDGPLMPPR